MEPTFKEPPFLLGKIIATAACVVSFAPFVILFKYLYEKHYEWRRENPSIYLFLYSHATDIIVWLMLSYWCYIAVTFQFYYTDYCESFNPTYGEDASPHDAVPISDPIKPLNFFSFCDTYNGQWNEYEHDVWPIYATEYRLKEEISGLVSRYFTLFYFFCLQQLAVPIMVCILIKSGVEIFGLIAIECLSVRSGLFFSFCVKRFYNEFYIGRVYFYQISCWCCVNKQFVPNVISLFALGVHAIFITQIVTVFEIISALDSTKVFYGQGMKYYEFYPTVALLVEQFIVQMVYMFPYGKYDKAMEWRRGRQYLLNKRFPKDIVDLINKYSTDKLRLEYDIIQHRTVDLTTNGMHPL